MGPKHSTACTCTCTCTCTCICQLTFMVMRKSFSDENTGRKLGTVALSREEEFF